MKFEQPRRPYVGFQLCYTFSRFPRVAASILNPRGSFWTRREKVLRPLLSASRSLEGNPVDAHYRQGFSQCKLLGLHVQIEHELFNMVIGPRRVAW